jgi:predicted DNA-binding helix-hairpin-helix protein
LTIEFYRRNYIEGLFLSSGIVRSPDDTMERLVWIVKRLRMQGFNGYIHLKCLPFASRHPVAQTGLYADRLSVNIELPLKRMGVVISRAQPYIRCDGMPPAQWSTGGTPHNAFGQKFEKKYRKHPWLEHLKIKKRS